MSCPAPYLRLPIPRSSCTRPYGIEYPCPGEPAVTHLHPPPCQVPRVPFQALAMVVPPQEPDRVPSTITAPPPVISKGQHIAQCERHALPTPKSPSTFLFLREQAGDEAAWFPAALIRLEWRRSRPSILHESFRCHDAHVYINHTPMSERIYRNDACVS